ncbi:MAG TPA: M56 family metallopeptidase [Verrucomicrobiae bacterium]|nr:M56 family metallopeptidase [Verrucomicrobiae bacterium]
MDQVLAYGWAAAVIKASAQGAVLIVLVLIAQRVFGRWLNARWRYSLWLLVLLRLALPWTVSSPVSVFNLMRLGRSSLAQMARAGTAGTAARLMEPALTGRPAERGDGSELFSAREVRAARTGLGWLLALWAAGVMVLTGLLLATHIRFWGLVARQRPLIDARLLNLLEDCKQSMGVRTPVTLVETAAVGSPALFGFVRPRLLLPAGLTRSFSLEELRHVFLHEVSHLKRHDILAGWVVTALQIVHWFNPLVWLAFGRMRLDRELACDAMALAYLRGEARESYGSTIIKLLESFGRSAWGPSLAGTVQSRNQIRERINMIARFQRSRSWPVLALGLFIALGAAALTDAEPADSPLSKELRGTWVMVGEPGHIGAIPAEGGRIKSLTDSHWSVTQADPRTGVVLFHHGGTYTVKGNEYDEHVEYADENTKELIGHTFRFKARVEGDTLTLLGMGNPWKEVWKRAPSSAPQKADAAALQGKWTGEVSGEEGPGAATLVVQGTSLEFRAPDTNEWYKATFLLFDTAPKQLVATVTASSVADFVGQTAYAIYQLKEGKLTLTGYAPGVPAAPASFDAPGARKFVFKK